MTHRKLAVWMLVLLALGAVLAPAAYAKGGVTVRTLAPPPLDAGSAVANPDYAPTGISPHGRVSPGPGARHAAGPGPVAPSHDRFDWGDAGIGAAGTLAFIVIGVAPVLLVRLNSRRLVRS